MGRNKAKVVEYVKLLDKVPELIKAKRSEDLKGLLTTKMYSLREVMEDVTTKGTPFYRTEDAVGKKEAKQFFQDLADLGVAGRERNWEWATESYEKSKDDFKTWMSLVNLWAARAGCRPTVAAKA